MKLTPHQQAVLTRLVIGPDSAYSMHATLSTLHSLLQKNLAVRNGGGHMFSPRTGMWSITAAGRAAIAAVSK